MPRAKWLVASLILLMPVFLFVASTIPGNFERTDQSDFFVFWMGANMIRQGQNPYIIQNWNAAYVAFDQHWIGISHNGYGYAPHFAYGLVPFTLISFDQAFIIWLVLSMILLVATLYLLMSTWKIPRAGLYIVPILFGLCFFRPLGKDLILGQMGGIYLFSIAMTIWLWDHDYWFLGSIALSILTFKTTFSIPVLAFTALWLLFGRRWKALLSLTLMAIGLMTIDWKYLGDWFSILTTHAAQVATDQVGQSITLWGVAGTVCRNQQSCTVLLGALSTIVLIGGLVVLLWLHRRTWSPLLILSLIVLISQLITPYMWPYDQLILVIPIMYVIYGLIEHGYPFLVTALFFSIISIFDFFLLQLAFAVGTEAWSAVLPVLLLGAVLYLAPHKVVVVDRTLVTEPLTI